MAKYMFIYYGPATDAEDMDEATVKEVMGKWQTWMEGLGSAMVDMGTPLGNGAAVVDDGSTADPIMVTGYSVVEADDIDGAKALADGHPFLSDSDGKFSIQIFEMMPVPGM